MSFLDIQFPTNISLHAVGGPSFLTNVVTVNSGNEFRDQVWKQSRGSWDVSHAARLPADADLLKAFFFTVRGRAYSWRFKDWTDFKVTSVQGVLFATGVTNKYQMYKRYVTAPAVSIKGSRQNSHAYVVGDIITLLANDNNIHSYMNTTAGTTAAAQSTLYPGVTGEVITDGSAVFTERMVFMDRIVTKPRNGPTSISGGSSPTIDYATGIVTSTTPPNGWSGEFDCHCRFDTDEMKQETIDKSGGQLVTGWSSIPVLEVRG